MEISRSQIDYALNVLQYSEESQNMRDVIKFFEDVKRSYDYRWRRKVNLYHGDQQNNRFR